MPLVLQMQKAETYCEQGEEAFHAKEHASCCDHYGQKRVWPSFERRWLTCVTYHLLSLENFLFKIKPVAYEPCNHVTPKNQPCLIRSHNVE